MAVIVKIFTEIPFFVLLVILLLNNFVYCNRKIQTSLNPGCDSKCDDVGGLAYLKAIGDVNTLHYIVSPIGPPTILVLLTENSNSKISITWDKLLSNNITEREKAIKFLPEEPKVLYTYGIVFTRLIQYNDTSDTANLNSYHGNDNSTYRVFDFSNAVFKWNNLGPISSDYSINLQVQTTEKINGQTINNGSLQFQINFFDKTDRASSLPHLQYTEDICQFDFLLKDIDTVDMPVARFALESVMFSNDKADGSMKFDETKSIDDEYTPGVFKISNWLTRPEKESEGAFLQHKPVCYTSSVRGRGDGTFVRGYSMSNVDNLQNLLNESILLAYFGYGEMESLRMYGTNFSFGLSEDGTFTKFNYTVWTASLGYGTAPADAVSSLVIGVISAGLGIPVVLILFGGLFVCIKRRSDPQVVAVTANVAVN